MCIRDRSGSNTAIEGGYTSSAATTYESGSSSNSTTTNNSTSNTKSAPPSAGAPSYNSMTQDVCAVGMSLGVQTFGIGISGGKHAIDKNCERLKLARILNDFGMKVAAVAILCQDERVFESMISAGTVCPIDGKIGAEAMALWAKYGHERPDYNTYMKRVKDREKADKKAQKIIQSVFPDRKVISINGIDISLGGGNIHCITQQQPLSNQASKRTSKQHIN